jgi:hypothetical protein
MQVGAEHGSCVADVIRQYKWYKAQGMIKGAASPDAIIDKRYAVGLN